jgi:hypothetical protein
MRPINEPPVEPGGVLERTTTSPEEARGRKSKRFTPTRWAERIVPIILAALLLALLVTLGIVILSIFGLIP